MTVASILFEATVSYLKGPVRSYHILFDTAIPYSKISYPKAAAPYSKLPYRVGNNFLSPNVLSTRATFVQNLFSRTLSIG